MIRAGFYCSPKSNKIGNIQRHCLLTLTVLLLASIAVGQTSMVSVQGGVNRPGVYSVDPEVTLSTAIRLAGGLIPFASSRAVFYRNDENGVPYEIPVMLQGILDHSAKGFFQDKDLLLKGAALKDLALKPGDVVYVPAPGTKPPKPTQPVIDDPVFPARLAQK